MRQKQVRAEMELEKNGAVLWRFMEGHKKALISNPGGDFNAIRDETARKRIQVPCQLPSAKISKKTSYILL